MPTRVRYAPSPTGDLHLGSLRTVLFNYLVAKKDGGTFIVRQEDTDRARIVEGSMRRQLEALRWAGLEPDEGVMLAADGSLIEAGPHAPYTQSQRLAVYGAHAARLLEAGLAYRCFAMPDELEAMRAAQQAAGLPPRYDGRFRDLPAEESDHRAAAEEPFVLRHRLPAGRAVEGDDLIRGRLTWSSDVLDDYVLMKSDGYPTYQLASVVDDHLMGISHVLRGEEWLPSLPKNLLLYEAFGWSPPAFAHVPVILGPDGKKKLSKRDGSVDVLSYRERGYLPAALLNALAFTGWSPGTEEEIFSLDELTRRFSLGRVQKSPAAFSFDRLDYVDGVYIRALPVGEVAAAMLPFLSAAGLPAEPGDKLLRVAALLRERLKRFDESAEFARPLYVRPPVTPELLALCIPKNGNAARAAAALELAAGTLERHDAWTEDGLEAALRLAAGMSDFKPGELLWPVRAALSGEAASPGAFELLAFFGPEESLERLASVRSGLRSGSLNPY